MSTDYTSIIVILNFIVLNFMIFKILLKIKELDLPCILQN